MMNPKTKKSKVRYNCAKSSCYPHKLALAQLSADLTSRLPKQKALYDRVGRAYAEAVAVMGTGKHLPQGLLSAPDWLSFSPPSKRRVNEKVKDFEARKARDAASASASYVRRVKGIEKRPDEKPREYMQRKTNEVRKRDIEKLYRAVENWLKRQHANQKSSPDVEKMVSGAYASITAQLIQRNLNFDNPNGYKKSVELYEKTRQGVNRDPRSVKADYAANRARMAKMTPKQRARKQRRAKQLASPKYRRQRLNNETKILSDRLCDAEPATQECSKRIQEIASNGSVFPMPKPAQDWIDKQGQILAQQCEAKISAALGKSIEEILIGSTYLKHCRVVIPNSTLGPQLVTSAKKKRKGFERTLNKSIRSKNFSDASFSVSETAHLFGTKWSGAWEQKIKKARDAHERELARQSAKAKKKRVAKCMRGLGGKFLCESASKLICGRRCGHHKLCPCCRLTQAGKKQLCGG